jgi:hypothetical protein
VAFKTKTFVESNRIWILRVENNLETGGHYTGKYHTVQQVADLERLGKTRKYVRHNCRQDQRLGGTWPQSEWMFVHQIFTKGGQVTQTYSFISFLGWLLILYILSFISFESCLFDFVLYWAINKRWSAIRLILASYTTVPTRSGTQHMAMITDHEAPRCAGYPSLMLLQTSWVQTLSYGVCERERERETERVCTNSDSFRNNLALFLVIQNFRNPYSVESPSFLLEADLSRMKPCEPLQCNVKCEAPRTGTGLSQGQGTWSEVAVGHHGQGTWSEVAMGYHGQGQGTWSEVAVWHHGQGQGTWSEVGVDHCIVRLYFGRMGECQYLQQGGWLVRRTSLRRKAAEYNRDERRSPVT